MADTNATVLAPHYYRDNFLRLCDTVEAQYADILTDEEGKWLARFRTLSFSAQCLYVRLISRVGPWFRESKLHYAELDNINAALDELLLQPMAVEAQQLSVEQLGKLYTKDELPKLFSAELTGERFVSKGALLSAIAASNSDERVSCERFSTFEAGRVVAPLGTEHIALLQHLFFGNRYQSLTDFILEDLGLTRYYPYPLDRENRLFNDRSALDETLECAALHDCFRELKENEALEQLPELAVAVLALPIEHASTLGRWHRLANSMARELERQKELQLAMQLYGRSGLHPARERRARICEANEDWQSGLELCQDILSAPWCEAEKEAAEKIIPRIERKLHGTKQSRRKDNFHTEHLIIPRDNERVELLTAAHLAPNWASVHYVENSLMNTLFGLTFWEQIFAAVPGVFHNPFQSAPADMFESEFADKRQPAIDERLRQLSAGSHKEILLEAYQKYDPYQCRGVDWRYISRDLVAEAAEFIPAQHLQAIFQRMLFDLRENRKGFPDLIAFGSNPGDYCMIEVKGPGDALQDGQKRWLRYFQTHEIPAQVAWVEWQDD